MQNSRVKSTEELKQFTTRFAIEGIGDHETGKN
jgi:hypothetical protein